MLIDLPGFPQIDKAAAIVSAERYLYLSVVVGLSSIQTLQKQRMANTVYIFDIRTQCSNIRGAALEPLGHFTL